MRYPRPILAATVGALITLMAAAPVSARTLVDPTSLTPPLKPFRICYQLGPYVQCDTSGVSTYENEPIGDFGCGEIYETATDVSNSTRWYQDALIIRRAAQERSRGFWSLAPTGAGPVVDFQRREAVRDVPAGQPEITFPDATVSPGRYPLLFGEHRAASFP